MKIRVRVIRNFLFYLFISNLFVIITSMPTVSQYDSGCETEFGIAYASLTLNLTPLKMDSIQFYASTIKSDPPFAQLKYGTVQVTRNSYAVDVAKFTLTMMSTGEEEEIGLRLIDLNRIDEYALPVLSFSPDSQWVNVSFDPRNLSNPQTGWLNISDSKKAGVQIKYWANFLYLDVAVVFNCDSLMAFYSRPDESSRIFPELKLFENSNEYTYSMKGVDKSGKWMQVYLYSPSPYYSGSEPPASALKVWIKYLDDTGRPRIWFEGH